ncbi:ParB/Srx family N-terminal domain-containing protein [Novosphingobium sp. G106]|uniref:ParB/Srx family N-terminal domain-containing protein n=1 Tax=Novosphingobium sp. G106 TaxID=2849500 RepID=UPI0020C41656|nr:ParB/Srx family N-terminal domain-containing protein [Novosphingobium sp. G106]
MTIQTIQLNKLALSDLNVRKVKPKEIEALAADIQARGVLQNLIGYDEDGKIKICAGGRRYRALKLLQKAKTIPGTFEVPVEIRSKDEALEISLAENAQREDMHPADAIAAYRAIIDSGKDVDDVAASFGVSPRLCPPRVEAGGAAPDHSQSLPERRNRHGRGAGFRADRRSGPPA